MSVRKGRRREGAGVPRGRRVNAARGRGLMPWAVGAVALVVVGAWWLLQRPGWRPTGEAAAPDSAARSTPAVAYQRALTLARQGRYLASVPYYRRAIGGVREDFWELHFNYSTALYNLTLEHEVRRGIQMPLLRSAYERVRTMRESLTELAQAERLARSAKDLADIQVRYARMMEVWGFPWETLVAYGRMAKIDPSRADMVRRAEVYSKLMRTPTEVPKD